MVQIIPKSSFIRVPWKNGGGVTREAVRHPPGSDPYDWRVSVAEIGVSGPFSSFVGYHRTMALLAGGGVRLSFAGGHQHELRQVGDLVEFDGAAHTKCDLLAGPCTDLNLIVAESVGKPDTRVERLGAPRCVRCDPGRATLVFVLSGSCRLTCAGSDASFDTWDLAVLVAGDEMTLTPVMPASDATPLLFFATLDDNRTPLPR